MGWVPIGIDGVFFISIATILASSFAVGVRYCLKSKCEHFSICFGLINIDRRVDLETQEHIREVELGMIDKDDVIEKKQPEVANRRPSAVKENEIVGLNIV
jgi:hypothetical protein